MALPLSRSLPALLKQYWYIKRGERVRVRGHAQFYATLGFTLVRFLSLFVIGFESSAVLPRWGGLRMLAYYRSCGQSGDYPEGQIYQQQIKCKGRPPVQPEISRAAHRQKEQEQCE